MWDFSFAALPIRRTRFGLLRRRCKHLSVAPLTLMMGLNSCATNQRMIVLMLIRRWRHHKEREQMMLEVPSAPKLRMRCRRWRHSSVEFLRRATSLLERRRHPVDDCRGKRPKTLRGVARSPYHPKKCPSK